MKRSRDPAVQRGRGSGIRGTADAPIGVPRIGQRVVLRLASISPEPEPKELEAERESGVTESSRGHLHPRWSDVGGSVGCSLH